jgi:hypothetical protein
LGRRLTGIVMLVSLTMTPIFDFGRRRWPGR